MTRLNYYFFCVCCIVWRHWVTIKPYWKNEKNVQVENGKYVSSSSFESMNLNESNSIWIDSIYRLKSKHYNLALSSSSWRSQIKYLNHLIYVFFSCFVFIIIIIVIICYYLLRLICLDCKPTENQLIDRSNIGKIKSKSLTVGKDGSHLKVRCRQSYYRCLIQLTGDCRRQW